MSVVTIRRSLPIELLGRRPECFSVLDWDLWTAAEAKSVEPLEHSGFCSDCTPAYKASMCVTEHCRYPNTTFSIDDENDIVGHRQPFDQRGATLLSSRKASRAFRIARTAIIESLQPPVPPSIRERLLARAEDRDDDDLVI